MSKSRHRQRQHVTSRTLNTPRIDVSTRFKTRIFRLYDRLHLTTQQISSTRHQARSDRIHRMAIDISHTITTMIRMNLRRQINRKSIRPNRRAKILYKVHPAIKDRPFSPLIRKLSHPSHLINRINQAMNHHHSRYPNPLRSTRQILTMKKVPISTNRYRQIRNLRRRQTSTTGRHHRQAIRNPSQIIEYRPT